MDTSVEAAMNVHHQDGSILKFREYQSRLYFYDSEGPSAAVNTTSKSTATDYLFLNTVAGQKARYTRRKIEGVDTARALYQKLGHPSEQVSNKILQESMIRNCPLTSDDAKRALQIYGRNVATLKGKTVKQKKRGTSNYQPIGIPAPIVEKYNKPRLFMDILSVNGRPYFHTISQWIKLCTVAPIPNRYKRTVLLEAKAVINKYKARGFTISRIEAGQEFMCITNDILPINLNAAAADDHVAEVERSIRTVKERTRCTVQGMPYQRIPRLMMRSAVQGAHKSLNQFLAWDGASDVF
jgi:hypothetical protein